jgi:hypothetical protein
LCAIFLVSGNGALAGEREMQASPDIFVAGNVAYKDFLDFLAESYHRVKDRSGEDSYDFLIFMTRIESYHINLEDNGEFFMVEFIPKDFGGNTSRGGGGIYKIRKNDFGIEEREFYR